MSTEVDGGEERSESAEVLSCSVYPCLSVWSLWGIKMSYKCPTSGEQTSDEEAAVQQSLHFKKSSFFYLSVLAVRT